MSTAVVGDAQRLQTVQVFDWGGISFGDNVKIRRTDATVASGHAELVGVCYGMTSPSIVGVDVIGSAPDDVALNVHFDDPAVEDGWFSPDLVLLVDHAVGSEAVVGNQRLIKSADGSWDPVDPQDEPRRWSPRRR